MNKRFAGAKCVLLPVVCLVMLLSFASPLLAQTASTGALTGTVTDPSGAVISGATVTATNTGTGQQRTATTDASGAYKFTLLPPGTYSVRFSASGFKTAEVPSVTVNVTESPVLNSKLEIGAQAQKVTVTGEAPVIETTSSAMGTVVGSTMMTELPLASRNYTNLLSLSAGVSAGVTNAASLGQASQESAVNGSASTQNNYQMDGAPINSYVGIGLAHEETTRTSFGIPNPDTIQEFKIQTSLYDAGYGRNPGGNVDVITKTGTNQFHGTGFEFLRNTVLNANDWFLNERGAPRGALDQNQFGGTIGGPVKKDKLFFFASYQQTGQKNGLEPFGSSGTFKIIPLPAGPRGSCPAGATALAQCDAATQIFVGELGTLYAGQAGVGAVPVVANGSNINPVTVQILQLKLANGSYYIPTANGANTAPGVTCLALTCDSVGGGLYHEYQGMGNWDYIINSKHTLSGRYFTDANDETVPFGPPAAISLPGTPAIYTYTGHYAVLKLTSTLSNTLVNEARVSYQRNTGVGANRSPFSATQVGQTPLSANFNLLSETVVGNMSIGTPIFTTHINGNSQWQFADQVSVVRGKQTMRFGFEVGYIPLYKFDYQGLSDGFLIMLNPADFMLGLPGCTPGTFPTTCNPNTPGGTTGVPVSNIIAEPPFATRYGELGGNHFREHSYDAFVQDDFKVTSRLTLNLGLRWEFNGYPKEVIGKNVNIVPALANVVPLPLVSDASLVNGQCPPFPAACPGESLAGMTVPSNWPRAIPAGVYKSPHTGVPTNSAPLDNFAPRLGFAWQPLATSKLVLRGGAGYFYDLVSGENFVHGALQSMPYAETLGGSGPGIYSASLQQPYISTPANWIPRWVTASGQSSNIAQTPIGPTMPTPTTYSWNLNTQYEFLPNWMLELGYVGSRGIHQTVWGYVNNPALLVPDPVDGSAPSLSNVNLRVPYPGFQPSITSFADNTDSKFNSLQATVRKRFSHGLSLQANYTWSRAFLSAWVGNPNVTAANTAPFPIISQYGLSTWYHPSRFTLQYSYTLPSGHLTGLAGKLASGWTWSGETTIQDGVPQSIQDSTLGSIFGLNGGSPGAGQFTSQAEFCPEMSRANIATPGSIQQKIVSGTGYFNKAAFCSADAPSIDGGTGFGNAGLANILGPGQNNWDMALIKNTKLGFLGENGAIQFRAEFFNAFNHPQFSNPGNNTPSSNPGAAELGTASDVNAAGFGAINSLSVNPRLVQFGLKLLF